MNNNSINYAIQLVHKNNINVNIFIIKLLRISLLKMKTRIKLLLSKIFISGTLVVF